MEGSRDFETKTVSSSGEEGIRLLTAMTIIHAVNDNHSRDLGSLLRSIAIHCVLSSGVGF